METSSTTAPTTTVKKTAKRKPAKFVNQTDGKDLAGFMDSKFAQNLGFRAAQKYWAEYGASTKKRGFRAALYRELAKKNLTAEQTLEFAKKNGGSLNDIKQIGHFQTISALIAEVRGEKKTAKKAPAKKEKATATG